MSSVEMWVIGFVGFLILIGWASACAYLLDKGYSITASLLLAAGLATIPPLIMLWATR